MPRPLISGLSPRRLYVHPDEQIEMLRKQKAEGKTGLPESPPEREWVLPSHLRERWTLKRFGEVFDAIDPMPAQDDGIKLFETKQMSLSFINTSEDAQTNDYSSIADDDERSHSNPWRQSQPKRLLLATLDDDSTIVYYIIHDGIVKPRQN